MKKATIAIDIDDVLADNAAGFVAFSNQRWGTTLTPEDYDEHWAKVWQVTNEEVEVRANEFHSSGIFNEYAHKDEALPVLNRLSHDYNLVIVTSRRSQTKDDTARWIHAHYPGIFSDEKIHFAGLWDTVDDDSAHKTKADIIDVIGADYLIDDQVKHCEAVAKSGRTALLFGNFTWNSQALKEASVIRVKDWAAVEGFFYHE